MMRWPTPPEALLLAIAAALIWLIVTWATPRAPAAAEPHASIDSAVTASLTEVMQTDADAVVNTLWSIAPDAPHIQWDRGHGDDRVLMATFTDFTGYAGHESELFQLSRDIWVSPVPQLAERCRGFTQAQDGLKRRMRQYLGLAPRGIQDRVIEFWVKPSDMFRPCPDKEIDDTSCSVGLPDVTDHACEPNACAHSQWFKTQFGSYYTSGALPWTRLGYTYDWGDPKTKVGASEFVVKRSAFVVVQSISPVWQYCDPKAKPPSRTLLEIKPTPPASVEVASAPAGR